MIDDATGYVPGIVPKHVTVTLRCPKCDRHRTTPLDESDPAGTVRVDCNCPNCAGDFQEIRYFDKDGKELEP